MKIGPLQSLGIMQGRLLPKYQGRYQAHPLGCWQEEFTIAAEKKLDYVEFILDFNDAEKNPLMSESGIYEIQKIIEKTGVQVRSVCADYFMEAPLHHSDHTIAHKSLEVLELLLKNSSKLGITDLVMPSVDQSSLKHPAEKDRFIGALNSIQKVHEESGVNIALETDLSPEDFAGLLEKLPLKRITVNYDTGNSASLGYDMEEEFAAYGSRISDIHIKDRKRNGGSVELGTGNTDFDKFFSILNTMKYEGIFVMQAYRDDEGIEIFDRQLAWLKAAATNRASK